MNRRILVAVCALLFLQSASAAEFSTRDVQFYSEAVLCAGKLFVPNAYSESSKLPAVVVVPAAGATQSAVEKYAASLAGNGVVAMTFDYRGWGRSGGFLYFGEPIRWDDRLRFTPLTSKMIVRRKRNDPQAQAIDIRNAITYLQGEAGVDRARIGVWGVGLSADHAIVVAASDARVKAFVAQSPTLLGKQASRQAFKPNAEQQAAMIALARTGQAPTTERAAIAMNASEEKLALAAYFPSWSLDSMPSTTAALFIANAGDTEVAAAAKQLKGSSEVVADPEAASGWLAKHL